MAAILSDELRGLFGQITNTRVPAAADLHEYFQARGLSIKPAGANLDRPRWATIAAPEDAFVEVGGSVARYLLYRVPTVSWKACGHGVRNDGDG
jgi:hypothetical protein